QLFPTSGQVTYALLSRPPLTSRASPRSPFDLHVSCTPPAFILSQDQTLRMKRNGLSVVPWFRGLPRSLTRIVCHSSLVKVQPSTGVRPTASSALSHAAAEAVKRSGDPRPGPA